MRTKSLFPYAGGKFYLINEIREVFEKSGRHVAVDVFGGSGKFLLNVEAKNKVYNDIDGRIVNLFRVVKERSDEFLRKFEFPIHSRLLFAEYKLNGEKLDPVEEAYRTFYLLYASYSANMNVFSYGIKPKATSAVKIENAIHRLREMHDDIKNWTIEHLDFRELVKRYDSEDAFFYLDPPYFGKKFYRYNFTEKDFDDLAGILPRLKGRYLLNINKNELILDRFGKPSREMEFKNFCDNGRVNGKRGSRTELFYWN